jgi:glycosyltransferase involved in cell wall biosynthesis
MTIGRVERDLLLAELSKASAGLSLYRGGRSSAACSPTKLPEYLAAGLPVVASASLGDIEHILGTNDEPAGSPDNHRQVGVVVDEDNPKDLQRAALELTCLMAEPEIGARCRAVAKRDFDLQSVGWTRYRRLYLSVVGQPCLERGRSNLGSRSQKSAHQTKAVPTTTCSPSPE